MSIKWIGKVTGGLLGALVLGPIGAALGVLLPWVGVAVVAAFNAFYWLPSRGESVRPRSQASDR